MIKIFNENGDVYPITQYEDYFILHKANGCDEMSFCVDVSSDEHKIIHEEDKIEDDFNKWIVKKIDDDKIDCKLDFDFLKDSVYIGYTSETMSLNDVLERHLPNGWTIEGASVSSIRRTISFDYCTDYDVIYECMKTYDVYFVWKMKENRLIVYSNESMQSTGEYLTSELNLTAISSKGDTTDFATRLYAFGENGLTIEEAVVDDGEGGTRQYGLKYVENTDYCDKIVCAYWSDDRYKVAQNLYEAALKKISAMSKPVRSYECDVVDLAKQNDEYSFLDFKLHKKVTLIDVERGIKVEHQIVEYKEYPEESERNLITLSTVPEDVKSMISSSVSEIEESSEHIKTDFSTRIMMATAMLTGAFGSYFNQQDGELFIMDDPDPAQAEVVWRWNVNGFGKSSTGIDGPYTTSLTFDDNFITSVINAITIRGSLIQAESIETNALSQSYKTEVTDEITSATNQTFNVTKGEFDSKIEELKSSIKNQNEEYERAISEIRQTADRIEFNFSKQVIGGHNIIKNSSGLNGLAFWLPIVETGGSVVAKENVQEAVANTSAKSMFSLKNGYMSQKIKVIPGETYVFSMKTKRNTNYECSAKIINGNVAFILFYKYSTEGWKEYSTYSENAEEQLVAKTDEFTIIISTDGSEEDAFLVADMVLTQGSSKHYWTPSPFETYAMDTIIDDNGVTVNQPGSPVSTNMANDEFAVKYYDEYMIRVRGDKTELQSTDVKQDLSVGERLRFIPVEDGIDIVLLD